jgi:hypothetical protein
MDDNRSLFYALGDNLIGFDDDYDTLVERGVKAIKKDPVGVAQQLGGSLYDSAKGFAGDFVRNPAGAITDSMQNLGLGYVEAGKRLYGGIGSYMNQGMNVEEARDAQLIDYLTLSELGGFGLLANQLRKGLTPNVNIAEGDPADPSRRKFIAGAAATVPVAALAPDVITDVATQVAKKGSRAAINPLDMAMANLKVLRKEIDDQNEILNEMGSIDVDASAGQKVIDAIKTRDDANRSITTAQYEMVDVAKEAIEEADPKFFTGASDDAIEEIIGIKYETFLGNQSIIPEHPNYAVIAQEIKRRGMDVAKDRNGISKYPNAVVFIEDFYQPIKSQAQKSIEEKISSGFLKPRSSMQMVRKADFADDYLNENANKIINEDIENIILDGRIDKKSTEEINKKILEYAETNRIAAPRRAFDNPKVEYVSTKEIADNIAQFNFPRYDVGKFGGDLPTGNINESPVFQERFDKSGKPTLKEDIFNEGIKEPIEIELVLSNGEISIGQGHHRLQAAIELNLPEVPVIVKTKEMPRPLQAAAVRPGRLNTSGFELYKDYSYSDLNFSDRLIEPKETNEELFRRGGSYFLNPETNEISDRRFPDKYTPMRKGFFRRTDKKAMGGSVQGIASLSDTARDMYRGPRGIGAYQQFMSA